MQRGCGKGEKIVCGRFQLDVSLETLEEMFESLQVPEQEILQTGELTPGRAISLIEKHNQAYALKTAYWGRKHEKGLQINARSERWGRTYLRYERCIIPASGYYEWNHLTKAKTLFEAKSKDLFFLAGILAVDELGKKEAMILTKDAEESIAMIHPRMPIVFDLSRSKQYLNLPEQDPKHWETVKNWQTRICSSEQMSFFK